MKINFRPSIANDCTIALMRLMIEDSHSSQMRMNGATIGVINISLLYSEYIKLVRRSTEYGVG